MRPPASRTVAAALSTAPRARSPARLIPAKKAGCREEGQGCPVHRPWCEIHPKWGGGVLDLGSHVSLSGRDVPPATTPSPHSAGPEGGRRPCPHSASCPPGWSLWSHMHAPLPPPEQQVATWGCPLISPDPGFLQGGWGSGLRLKRGARGRRPGAEAVTSPGASVSPTPPPGCFHLRSSPGGTLSLGAAQGPPRAEPPSAGTPPPGHCGRSRCLSQSRPPPPPPGLTYPSGAGPGRGTPPGTHG